MRPMQLSQPNPDILILEHVPWGLLASLLGFMSIWVAGAVMFILDGAFGGGLVLLGLGTLIPMAAIYFLINRNQLVFDRTKGTLDHRRRDFRGFTCRSYPLGFVERVYVAKDTPKLGSLFYQISEGMDVGHHRFLPTNAKLDSVVEAADTINAWLSPE